MRPYGGHLLCLSFGKPYGGLRLLVEFPFLCGQRLWEKFLIVINLLRGALEWWVGVVCVNVMGRLWTTFWYIIVWLLTYGVLFFGYLGFSGYYWRRFLIYYVDGGLGGLIICQQFGTLFPYVCYGLSGGKEIDVLLKMWSLHQLNY